MTWGKRCGLVVAALVIGALISASLIPGAAAQDAAGQRLIDQAPFDLVTLDRANENKIYKVHPIHFAGRRVPEKPKQSDKIRVKLLENDQEYDIAWFNISKIELYEQLVLAETNKLTLDGKFDEAYEYLAFLLNFYPNTPGLAEARQNYLYQASGAAFREQKFEEALAILEELLQLNPAFRASENSPTAMQAVGNTADRLLAAYDAKHDYHALRTLLERLVRQHKAQQEPFAQKWRQRLVELATQQRDAARRHLEEGRYVEARDAVAAMQSIWPDVEGASELAAAIASRHAIISVAVEHPAKEFDVTSLHNWSARRAGRLTERRLTECIAVGSEGGKYESPLGSLELSDDSLTLSFRLALTSDSYSSYELMQRLLARAEKGSPQFDPSWQLMMGSIELVAGSEVRVHLRTPNVIPQAQLQLPLQPPAGPYAVHRQESESTRFVQQPDFAFRRDGQPAEIIERYYADPPRAIEALKRGEVDVLDHVFPADLDTLRGDSGVTVAPYAAPTTHVLAIASQHPFLRNRTFRRALLYGIQRELLLSQGILRGKSLLGFRVISSPFPAPVSGLELPTYAYDTQIEPRAFDPQLALALKLLAEGEVKATFEKQEQEVPSLAPMMLGHPADETSRIACRGIVAGWKKLGIECKLLEFPPGVFDDKEGKCDLVYLQLAAWEPPVSAARLLGPQGIAPAENPFIQLAVRQIQTARNWQEVRERHVNLHRLLHEDVTVLPLWQTLDHFAYRKSLAEVATRPVRLYQTVEQWHTANQLARREP